MWMVAALYLLAALYALVGLYSMQNAVGAEWSSTACDRPMVVEVRHVLGQYRHQMAAVDDQYPIQQFAAVTSDPAFGDRVRPPCRYRDAQDEHAFAGEHGIKKCW